MANEAAQQLHDQLKRQAEQEAAQRAAQIAAVAAQAPKPQQTVVTFDPSTGHTS